jgi:small subunit ribosomal protein S17
MSDTKKNQRQLLGTVIKSSGSKTVSVLVERKVKHPVYGKYVKKSRKYLVHDENSDCKIGDTVVIFETKPLSKTKSWYVNSVLN